MDSGATGSGGIDMEGIADIFKRVLQSEGVARKTDLEALGNRISNCDRAIEQHDEHIADLKTTLGALRVEPQELRPERAAAKVEEKDRATAVAAPASNVLTAAPGSAMSGRSEEWQPRTVHARGFAPFGCGPDAKLRKQECEPTVQGQGDDALCAQPSD